MSRSVAVAKRAPFTRLVPAGLALFLLGTGAVQAGAHYNLTVRENGAVRERMQVGVQDGNVRMGRLEDAGGALQPLFIFRGDREQMVVIDHDRKSYMVLDREAIEKLTASLAGLSAEMDKMLERLPPEQREMARKMMQKQMGAAGMGATAAQAVPALDVRSTGKRAEQAGYPCTLYEVYRGEEKVREAWVADWDAVHGSSEVQAAFHEMGLFFEDLMKAMEKMPGAAGMGAAMGESPFRAMDKMAGFPVLTREIKGGKAVSETQLDEVEQRSLAASDFEPPAGYTEQKMELPSR